MTTRDAWKPRFEAILETARAKYAPLIVLWGPAESDAEGFAKRQRVKGAIRQESARAEVIYPEDPEAIVATDEYVKDPDMQEHLQAACADLVFALDISPGVSEEVARYSTNKKIAHNLRIIAPESKRDGYGGIIRRTLKVQFVREADLKECRVVSGICQTEVRGWLISKILQDDPFYI